MSVVANKHVQPNVLATRYMLFQMTLYYSVTTDQTATQADLGFIIRKAGFLSMGSFYQDTQDVQLMHFLADSMVTGI